MTKARTLCSVIAVLLLLGCSEDPSTRLHGEGERYVRRALPFREGWSLESETVRIQRSPSMMIWEVSESPDLPPTPEQQRVADELVERCYESALRNGWHDFEKGLADGYRRLPNDETHYKNEDLVFDDAILDPDRPEFLMYKRTPEGHALVGYMFLMSSRFERGPQIGGPLTLWHYHVWSKKRCASMATPFLDTTGFIPASGRCPEGYQGFHRSYEMLHVWLIDRPRGPFSTSMMLPPAEVTPALAKRERERGF
jgi:hypothetical protein